MKRLVLFFTFNVSLKDWIESGIYEREKMIYEYYIKNKIFGEIYWLTYGPDDEKYRDKLSKGIKIIPMPFIFKTKIGKLIYSFIIPFYYRNILKNADVLKTNQINGSWSAVITGLLWKKSLIVRTGWTWTINKRRELKGKTNFKYFLISLIEKIAYKLCDIAEVTSTFQKKYIIEKYSINKNKIYVIPNFIDTKIFKIKKDILLRKEEFIFVGRLEEEKNLFNLVKASWKSGIKLNIYGNGSLLGQLKSLTKNNDRIKFHGNIPNDKLPEIYNKCKYFILPSFYEGMPKVLLEAMACGCFCIGTNTTGINEIIKHKKNGYLIKNTDEIALLNGIEKILSMKKSDIKNISINSVEAINKKFSLESIFKTEIQLIKKVI